MYLDIEDEELKKSNPFNEDYQTQFNNFKKKVIKACTPKLITNLSLNGNLFYGILQEYASTIFAGEYMFVESPLTNVVFSNLGEITEVINENFKEKLEEKNNNVYDIIQQMKNLFEVFSDGLLNDYHNSFIGKLLHTQFMTEEVNNILSSISDELLDTNINEKLKKFNDDLKELTEKESNEKILKIESVPDIKKNLNTFSTNIIEQLEKNIFTKENEFLSSFSLIKDYIIKCITNKIKLYADSIIFYIDHNMQSIENSSKSNEAALEAKVQELNEKQNQLNDMKTQLEMMERDIKTKEEEFKAMLQIEKEKNLMIKNLENKYDELNRELKNYYAVKDNNDELSKLKKENLELKVNLGIKEKQLSNVNNKLKEFGDTKLDVNKQNKELNSKSLKDIDIQKIKEMFKVINKTVSEYAEKVNKLEQNKDMVFHDKFIEFSKSTLKKICKNWNEELSHYKEEHFKTMVDFYTKEISDLRKDNEKLLNEIELLYTQINDKNSIISKLKDEIKLEQEKVGLQKQIVKTTGERVDAILKESEIYKVRIKDKEDKLAEYQEQVAKYKAQLTMMDDDFQNFKELVKIINRRDQVAYNKNISKTEQESRELLESLSRNIFGNKKN